MKYRLVILLICCICFNIRSQNLDVRMLDRINSPETGQADGVFKLLSNTTAGVSLAIPLTIGLVGYLSDNKDRMYASGGIALSSALSLSLTLGLKYMVNRERPYQKYPSLIFNKANASDPSFPSGHTSSAFATATSLSLAFPKWYVIAPSYIWAGSVAYSRMYLGVHYPTDVLVGMLVGVASAYIAYKGNQWLTNKYQYFGKKQ